VRAGEELPGDPMRRALDNWDKAAPPLLALLEASADGRDRSEEAAGAMFFILHLAGQARERRPFPAVCRLARDPEALEAALDAEITSTLASILIGTRTSCTGCSVLQCTRVASARGHPLERHRRAGVALPLACCRAAIGTRWSVGRKDEYGPAFRVCLPATRVM
jgi:hypothetical protein